MKKLLIAIVMASLMAGCASKPTKVKFYPATTEAEHERGHGSVMEIDYSSQWRFFCKSIF